MAKRQLTRRQSWRIEKVQEERAARAAKRESRLLDELEGGDLGAEQTGLVIAHFGVQVEVEALEGELTGQVQRCHLRANLPPLVTGDRVVWRSGNQGHGVIVAQLPRHSELCRPDMRGLLKPVAANVDLIVIVFAPLPHPHANLIDRYLVAAEHAGIREFGLVHVSRDDVEAGFIEFRDLLGTCRFRDCKHDREPGCALLKALEDGRIQPQRMASYRHILASLPEPEYCWCAETKRPR